MMKILTLAFMLICAAAPVQAQFVISDDPTPLEMTIHPTPDPNHIELRFKLAKGWKTYALDPGDSGIAPQVKIHTTRNVKSWDWYWPRPKPFMDGKTQSIGYDRDFTVQFTLTPKDSKKPVAISATLEMGTCQTLCVPVSIPLEYDTNLH